MATFKFATLRPNQVSSFVAVDHYKVNDRISEIRQNKHNVPWVDKITAEIGTVKPHFQSANLFPGNTSTGQSSEELSRTTVTLPASKQQKTAPKSKFASHCHKDSSDSGEDCAEYSPGNRVK